MARITVLELNGRGFAKIEQVTVAGILTLFNLKLLTAIETLCVIVNPKVIHNEQSILVQLFSHFKYSLQLKNLNLPKML